MKTIFMLLIILTFNVKLIAQKQHELNASYGVVTTEQIITSLVTVTITVVGGVAGNYLISDFKSTGGLFLTYRHHTKNGKAAFGLAMGIDNTKGKIINASTNVEKGTITSKSFTIAGEGLVNYLNKEKFKLYGFLGAGYSTIKFSYTPSVTAVNPSSGHFNFQATPIGFRFGKDVGGFIELGFGYKGLFNAGLFANF
jgi:hypothetical protein